MATRTRRSFWICTCGDPIYDHSVKRSVGSQEMVYVHCRIEGCPCERFQAGDGSNWPEGPANKVKEVK